MAAGVDVRGLREVGAALRKVDKDLPKQIRVELQPIAAEVAAAVRAKVPRRTGKAQASVRPRSSQRGAAVAVGGQAAPYYPWLDWGGSTGPGHRPGVAGSGAVKRPWLGKPGGDGRYLYPAIAEKSDDIEKAAEAAVVNVAKRAQLGVK